MVVQRIWNFVSRHRKKLIFTGIVAGGVYYYVKVKLPKIQADLFDSLLKELTEGASASNGQVEEQQRRVSFQKHQEVSDSYARKGLQNFLVRLQGCFKIDQCQAKVKAASDREQKLAALKELQVECLSMVASAAYSLYVILLLHRVQFNIAGREAISSKTGEIAQDGAESAAMQELIASTDYFLEKGAAMIVTATRSAVQAASLQPDAPVSTESLTSFFKEVFEKLEKEIWADGKGSALLPPDANSASQAKPLLDEARDYLESPQLLQALRSVTSAAAERLPFDLGKATNKAEALKEGTVPLAALFGGCISLAKEVLQDSTCTEAFIQAFADQTVISQFCEALYFQETK
ncbi:unnamed protein product [Durusdinium trenchii]|uniref:Peroxisomal assembly protein PEX3 n=1 Tax=Durusdinium trenchii TaxID=1381693 RepID=A0ABP0IXN9_9DINO